LYSTLARQGGGRLLASSGEHASVTENLQTLERLGKPIGRIPIDSNGRVTEALLSKALEKYRDARFAAIMAVNNEVGSINTMAALCDILRGDGARIHLHGDMVQAIGKIPLDISGWGIDSASFSAHKIGGPRGIGLLYLRRPMEVLYAGGGQERKIRPGTENLAGALALADCLEKHALPEKIEPELANARRRWKRLFSALNTINRCRVIPAERGSDDENFSPYIVQLGFKGIPGEVMVRALDDRGFAVSTGSACASASPERPVLAAMGVAKDLSLEGIRISQGWSTTDEEIERLISAIMEVLKFL
jgi:cysteine desulfurase